MYDPSFTSIYNQPMFSSSYMSHELVNLSKSTPHYITLEDQDTTIFNQQFQQPNNLLSNDHHSNYKTNINVEIRANDLQSASRKCVSKNNNGDINGFINNPKKSNKRRRASKNDRHSKIDTAQGPRDRRMRLSLEVAKKFFKLQDMLGFDKASKTVDWLLMKSESNIQELMIPYGKSLISESSTSSKYEQLLDDEQMEKSSNSIRPSNNRKKKKKSSRVVRESSYLLRPLAKETREMARKRARERTVEKSSSKISGINSNVSAGGGDDQIIKFKPCFDQALMDEGGVNCLGSNWIINQPHEQPSSHFQFKQGINIDDNWNPISNSLFNYDQHNTGLLHAHDQHDQLINDFQILGNLWEAGYN